MRTTFVLILTAVIGMLGMAQEELSEEEKRQRLAQMSPRERAFFEIYWEAKKFWKGEKKGDLIEYCRRALHPKEKDLIERLIAFAGDQQNDWRSRCRVIEILSFHPHVSMIDALKELAWNPPLEDEKSWKYKFNIGAEYQVNAAAVGALRRIADERVISILIDVLEHPGSNVRYVTWESLQILLGVRFEAKGWQRLKAMWEMGKITWEKFIKSKEKEMRNLENWREVKVLYTEWWERNKAKAKINWKLAWLTP